MHYRIYQSFNKKEKGLEGDQSIFYSCPIPIHDERSVFSNYHTVENIRAIEIPKPVLVKGAKPTDLLSTGYAGHLLFTSDKLKKLLFSTPYEGIQSIPTSIEYKGEEVKDFWIVRAFEFNFRYIDFSKSVVCESHFSKETGTVKVRDADEFIELIRKSEWPNSIGVKRLYLSQDIPVDFFSLRFVDGIGYYVSEDLKMKIETAGCTGISFIREGTTVYEFLDETYNKKNSLTALNEPRVNNQGKSALLEAYITDVQRAWISEKKHAKEIPFILENWNEEKHYEPEKAATAIRIAIDAWRLGFLDTWNEEILDAILEKQFDKDELVHVDAFKEHLQLQILLARREFKKESYFRPFLRALLDTLANGF